MCITMTAHRERMVCSKMSDINEKLKKRHCDDPAFDRVFRNHIDRRLSRDLPWLGFLVFVQYFPFDEGAVKSAPLYRH
jgi:hypothetical protein